METATLEEQAPTTDTAQVYFHGTMLEAAGQSIIRDGVLRAHSSSVLDAIYGKSFQRPVEGRVYVTSSLKTAVIYALGASVLGDEHFTPRDGEGRTGYVCVIRQAVGELQLDEDELGKLPSVLASLDWYSKEQLSESFELALAIIADPVFRSQLEWAMKTYLPEHTRKKAAAGWAVWQSKAGKKLLKTMRPALLARLKPFFKNGSTGRPVQVSEVWAIDKSLTGRLTPDGSNFFAIAKRVA